MCGFVPTQQHGGQGGAAFSDDLTQTCRLAEVNIRHGSKVDAIQAVYTTPSRATITGPMHGGDGGSLSNFKLENDEYITRIEGRFGGRTDALRFTTNKGRSFGPYGGDGGAAYVVEGVQVRGFLGRSGDQLDAIAFFTPGKRP
jgi:Jacalin-like lectin domain